YEAFIHIVHKWSFIWMLKGSRIGNSASGWKAAKLVSYIVDFLTCPCPGINIPVKILFVSVDVNFKLEMFEVSSKEKDPGLGSGLVYFVD
ncbi:hypothetical protein F5146DRAFT_935772, partial [Armillaria mellea]